MEKYYVLIINWNDSNYGTNQAFRFYKTLEKATKGFKEEKGTLIKKSLEDLEEEDKKEYLEEVEGNEMFDLCGDYEMSCVDPNGEWNLYVVSAWGEE